ncbi:DSBA-like thioredoxin domain-containing protein [Pavlovales sp. CCMP2436]|nr:DSBA-like thioredoxin domain-containing protein [Pavlovales sp. CCMP2436]
MAASFQEVGVKYSLDGLTGNTFEALRLLAHAEKAGGAVMQDKLMDVLFLDYFERARHVADPEVLLAAALAVGVPDAQRVLSDPEWMKEETVSQMKHFGRGVRGVPYFIISGGTRLCGAQPTEAWEEIIEQELEKAGRNKVSY